MYASECLFGVCTVDTTDDTHDASGGDDRFCDDGTGHCSLRAAIETYNNSFHVDTIEVPRLNQSNPTYFLTLGTPLEITATESDLLIHGQNNPVIHGCNEEVTECSNTTPTAIFRISNDKTQTTIEISGVQIQYGRGGANIESQLSNGLPGVIFIHKGSSLRLTNSAVANNHGGFAAGIMNLGYLELNSCKVNNNTATRGGQGAQVQESGAITNFGEADIIATEITMNCGFRGGGIENGGVLRIARSLLFANRAAQGGAIFNGADTRTNPNQNLSGGNTHAQLYIDNSVIEGNSILRFDSQVGDPTKDCQNQQSHIDKEEWNGGAISNGAKAGRASAGGAISTSGEVHIRSSTIGGRLDGPVRGAQDNRNWALRGGAIENGEGGYAEIFNSTISGNAAQRGGGIYNTGKMDIRWSTITKNDIEFLFLISPDAGDKVGGGIDNEGVLQMESTILAGNTARKLVSSPPTRYPLFSPDCFSRRDHSNGYLVSFSDNLVGVFNENCDSWFNLWVFIIHPIPPFLPPTFFDFIGSEDEPLEPMLCDLDRRPTVFVPGFTPTHRLKQGSPAIDKVVNIFGVLDCPEKDQRGRPRPVGTFMCDIGAFELDDSPPCPCPPCP